MAVCLPDERNLNLNSHRIHVGNAGKSLGNPTIYHAEIGREDLNPSGLHVDHPAAIDAVFPQQAASHQRVAKDLSPKFFLVYPKMQWEIMCIDFSIFQWSTSRPG